MKCPLKLIELSSVHVGYDEEDVFNLKCSYCGSLSQEEFFSRIKLKARLIPTDKNYKVYVDNYEKFYFYHLDVDGQKQFIQMLNNKELNISTPGHFYINPFFMTLKTKES